MYMCLHVSMSMCMCMCMCMCTRRVRDAGTYLGIPHRLVFRPHIKFNPKRLAYKGKALALDKVRDAISTVSHKYDVIAALACDYSYRKGTSDHVMICGGVVTFLAGFSDDAAPLSKDALAVLLRLEGPAGFTWRMDHGKEVRVQPEGVPEEGFAFIWAPADGEIVAAGPKAPKAIRPYVSSFCPLADAPPL